jgi:peptidylprolyl isomerase
LIGTETCGLQSSEGFLAQYAGRKLDLFEPSHKAAVLKFLKKAAPRWEVEWQSREVFVWRPRESKALAYVMLVFSNAQSIPGQSFADILVFDQHQSLLVSHRFPMGWRLRSTDAQLRDLPDFGSVVEIKLRPVINGAPLGKVFIGFQGSRPALLRIEDESGKYFRNDLNSPNHSIGPVPHYRTTSQWRASLDGRDNCEVLDSLNWLSSGHFAPQVGPERVFHEKVKEAVSWREAALSPGIRKRVYELTASPVPWISETAVLALKQLETTGLPSDKEPEERTGSITIEDLRHKKPCEFAVRGRCVKVGDRISITYTIKSSEGKIVSTNIGPGMLPYDVEVGNGEFFEGFDQGLVGMKWGGIRRIHVPSSKGFRSLKVGDIPPHSDFIVEIEVHDISRKDDAEMSTREVKTGKGAKASLGMLARLRIQATYSNGVPIPIKGAGEAEIVVQKDSFSGLNSAIDGMRAGGIRRVRLPFCLDLPGTAFNAFLDSKIVYATVELLSVRKQGGKVGLP